MEILKNLLLCSLLVMGLSACKTASKPARPMEQYDAAPPLDQSSSIHIPLRIDVLELERSINEQISGMIYEDNDPNDGDKLALKVEKKDSITLTVSNNDLLYRVPINLWFKYNAGITYVTGTAELAIQFRTSFDIHPDWSVSTVTQIEDHQWLRKPKLQVGAINIPVGFIGDIVLNRSRATITASIDKMAKEQLNLRAQVEEAWRRMFDPILVAPAYNTWLVVNPQLITMTPLQMNVREITAAIMIESKPRIKIGSKPAAMPPTPLPPFKYTDATAGDFVVFLNAEVPYEEAERLAKEQLLGESFSSGGRSVTVENIELYGKGNTLIVNTQLSGSYKGSIYLEGRPYFNWRKNSIDVSDLNFTLETQSFLHKSAAWLLKSNLKRRIQENLDFFLAHNLKELETELQGQLNHFQVSPNIFLQGKLSELQIQNAYLAPEAIRVHIGLRGNVMVHVHGLN
jgi:hypothetical protein